MNRTLKELYKILIEYQIKRTTSEGPRSDVFICRNIDNLARMKIISGEDAKKLSIHFTDNKPTPMLHAQFWDNELFRDGLSWWKVDDFPARKDMSHDQRILFLNYLMERV